MQFIKSCVNPNTLAAPEEGFEAEMRRSTFLTIFMI